MRHFLIEASGWISIGLGMLLLVPATGRATSPIWAPPALTVLIEEGLAENQELQGLEDKVVSLKKEIALAGSLDDPRLGVAILNLPTDTFDFDQEPMTQKQIFIAQKFPWFGKLDLRSQRAALMAVRQQAILEAKRLELARKIADGYYELGFVGASLEINERLTEMVNQLLRVAESRYATGRGLQHDVLQAQVELSKLLDEKIRLDRIRRTREDQVNELLNREGFTSVQPPKGLEFPDLRVDVAHLQKKALKENLQLKVRRAEIDIAAVEIELARKDYWPDMDVKLAYGQREEDFNDRDLPNFVSASVTLSIPLWQNKRQDSQLAAAKNDHEAAIKFYRNLAAVLPHRVDALVSEILNMQKNYRLFRDALLFQADQWAGSSLSAYEVGAVEFNTMINAHIRLLRFELQTINYLFKIYQKRAELEEVLGGSL